jgi:hypothetical protein
MLKIGDTVRFVNAVGGGVVSRLDEKKDLVYVEDEDGFEIPVLARECVVVPKVNPTTNFPLKDFSSSDKSTAVNAPDIDGASKGSSAARQFTGLSAHAASGANAGANSTPATLSSYLQTASHSVELFETAEGDHLQVVLAFIPLDIKSLQTSDYEAILINDSNYFLMYSLLIGEKGQETSAAQGVLEPNMQEQLTVLTNADLNGWENVRVQALAYKIGKSFCAQDVMDVALRIAPLKFYKLHSFTENEYFDELAMLFPLHRPVDLQMPDIDPVELKRAMLQKESDQPQSPKRERVPLRKNLIEVDLHIHELIDDFTGLSNADMLQLQLEKFHAVIAENCKNKGQKIVFIHGKGEGVLRNEIMKALKTRYKSYYVQDASFREYGFGATMITVF